MNRSRLVLLLTLTLATTTLVMGLLGLRYNFILIVLAVPFAIATGFLWYHASGKLAARVRRSAASQSARSSTDRDRANRRSRLSQPPSDQMSIDQARTILGVGPSADTDDIHAAFRRQVLDAHPDRATGSEEEFKQLRAAYERLTNHPSS